MNSGYLLSGMRGFYEVSNRRKVRALARAGARGTLASLRDAFPLSAK